ncbi:DUF2243 domain-containing protein [Arthrobacter gengyunqii]|uniref:DUF2243 domain-containing protein n=1 Tax=Arthrobacter gengyunqii TaxID=2886940 RepID=A0A9X1S7S2_9MICC|nr:DUF2243 domain-containing protein [Arthrobacter gengyunqii]MCC3270671.1 DUF2243 domain-containing protein [Arthrobacter gengyunqii]UOY96712.1 DUF2243 domain-containing protein [Arthrobacter gengyunqii]
MSTPTRAPVRSRRRNVLSGVLVGIGIAAFVDEVVFHQLLQWHHFYDKSTTAVGLFSDGLFHAFGWFAVVAGLFLFADLRRRAILIPSRWAGAVLLGTGAFQLYDGTVQHKLMELHQIRYNVPLLPYDLLWNLSAAAMILAGAALLYRTRHAKPDGDRAGA